MKKVFLTALALGLCATMPVPASAGDDSLLRILQDKGVLTSSEVARINEDGQIHNQNGLLRILQDKGVLTSSEVTRINAGGEKKGQPQNKEKHPAALQGLSIGLLGFIDYSAGKKAEAGNTSSNYNNFGLTRGYLTVKKKINPWLSARITTDIHRDSTAGAGTNGDYTLRLKYLYAEMKPHDIGPFTAIKMEVGQGHNPWLDFEEHVNPYRVQGTMAVERAGIFNSADLGVSLRGNFGGRLKDAKALTGNSHYNGLYGSWHIGLYNGAGYHGEEANGNKAIEGRLTVRPLPDTLPGLQASYLGMYGEGNKDASPLNNPDFSINLEMLSYEHPLFILTGQYFQTSGNASGSWTAGPNNNSLDTKGYSLFGRVRLPVINENLSVFGRYDHFDEDADHVIADNTAYDLYIGGLSYDIAKGNQLLFCYETTDFEVNAGRKHKTPTLGNNLGDEQKIQIAYQLEF